MNLQHLLHLHLHYTFVLLVHTLSRSVEEEYEEYEEHEEEYESMRSIWGSMGVWEYESINSVLPLYLKVKCSGKGENVFRSNGGDGIRLE